MRNLVIEEIRVLLEFLGDIEIKPLEQFSNKELLLILKELTLQVYIEENYD